MLDGTEIKIDILVGLPGSGKTYYANTMHKLNDAQVVDFDLYQKNYPGLEKIITRHCDLWNPYIYLIFDGLFTTNDSQTKIITEWVDFLTKNKINKCVTEIRFIYFEENREFCLINDSYRDESRRATNTIKTGKLELPKINLLSQTFKDSNCNFKMILKEVYCMSNYDGNFGKYKNEYWSNKLNKDVLVSEKWCVGGCNNYYDGTSYPCEVEKQPSSFKEFDELLLKFYPNISYLMYKKFFDECVTIEEDSDYDYYNGRQDYEFYCCDLRKLFDLLLENNCLSNENED